MSLPKYPAYKDTGVEWLGEIPSHWNMVSLKFECDVRDGTHETPEYVNYDKNTFPLITSKDLVSGKISFENLKYISEDDFIKISKRSLVEFGDLLMPMIGTVGGAVIVETNESFAIKNVALFKPTKLNAKWLKYFLDCELTELQFDLQKTGGVQAFVSLGILRNLKVLQVPFNEQTLIAQFLDRKTAKIDDLIAEQEKLITLLDEKRQAMISHAVTKGLNPDAKMKDSGVEWLGEVPESWDVYPTKRLFKLVVEPAPVDNSEELLSVYTAIGVRPRKSLEAKGNKSTTTDGYWRVKKGDIIVNKLLAWMGAMGVSEYDGVTSPAYDILRQTKPLIPQFYDYLFRCGVMFGEFRRYSRGIMDMRLRLYFEEFGQLDIPYPSIQEQEKIVSFLGNETTQMDTLKAEAQRGIDLLKERRSALISAAVTGKIDVRGLVNTEAS